MLTNTVLGIILYNKSITVAITPFLLMEIVLGWTSYIIVNYFIIAFAYALMTSLTILRQANAVALDFGESVFDKYPITIGFIWIAVQTFMFPFSLRVLLTKNYCEIIADTAMNLLIEEK